MKQMKRSGEKDATKQSEMKDAERDGEKTGKNDASWKMPSLGTTACFESGLDTWKIAFRTQVPMDKGALYLLPFLSVYIFILSTTFICRTCPSNSYWSF